MIRTRGWRKDGTRTRRSRGQSLVEFALILPILIALIGAIIQFAILLWAQNTLTQVARDTGRWAATQQIRPCSAGSATLVARANDLALAAVLVGYSAGEWSGGGVTYPASPQPREAVELVWTGPVGTFGTDCPPDSNQSEWFVTVRLDHAVPAFFPGIALLMPSCAGDGCAMSSTVETRMEPSL